MAKTRKGLLVLAEGFSILAEYNSKRPFSADEGGIYVDVSPEQISDDDMERLHELGWRDDDDLDCMRM